MKKQKLKKAGFILCLCAMLFVCLVLLVFLSEQRRLKQEFDTLVSDNLTSYTHIQRSQIRDLIRDVENTLTAISKMASSPSCSASEAEMSSFLSDLGAENDAYQVEYVTLDRLRAGAAEDGRPGDRQAFEQLLRGEPVISDILYSEQSGGYYLAIARPVVKGGETTGALRVRISAEVFERTFQEDPLYQSVYTCLIDAQGKLLYSNAAAGEYPNTGNLFTSVAARLPSGEAAEELRRCIASGEETTYQIQFKGGAFFVSTGNPGYNGWVIVNFLRSSDVLCRSDRIARRMILSSGALIVLTAAVSGAMVFTFMRQKRKLDLEVRRYTMLSQFSDTILFEYHYETDGIEFTPNARQRLALSGLGLERITSGGRRYDLLHPDDQAILVEMIRGAPAPEESEQLFYCEVRLKELSGSYCWYGCQCRYIFAAGAPAIIIGKLVDITDQRSREKLLLERSRRDVLTDTYNKSGEQIISEILALQARGLFFMIDLDNFKSINDTYGHAAGDALLIGVGDTLKGIFRADDIVARIGGDEFVVFIPNSSDPKLAGRKARDILDRLRAMEVEQCPGLCVSVSIGISVAPQDGCTYGELYACADKAMYVVKSETKNDYRFYQS